MCTLLILENSSSERNREVYSPAQKCNISSASNLFIVNMTDYPGDVLAACSTQSFRLWRPAKTGESYGDSEIESNTQITAVAWNRNNKVIAAGCQDGSVQLFYGSGDPMTKIPRRSNELGQVGSVHSLSWSVGSKKLAAGLNNGGVDIHDMTSKSFSTLYPKQTADSPAIVEFHPDDKFLAVATTASTHLHACTDLSRAATLATYSEDRSTHTSLSAAVAESTVAAGTAAGTVLLWDTSTQALKETYCNQHLAGIKALQFAPLQPSILFSGGADGTVRMLDRRTSAAHNKAVHISLGSITSMSIKEDCTLLALGTKNGIILLYDPRDLKKPVLELESADDRSPVTDLHWQHGFISLSSKARNAFKEDKLPFAKAVTPPVERAYNESPKKRQSLMTPTLPAGKLSSGLTAMTPMSVPPIVAAPELAGAKPLEKTATLAHHLSGMSSAMGDSPLPPIYDERVVELPAKALLDSLTSDQAWQIKASPANPVSPLKHCDADGQHGLREDILALHFDMLQQFQAQQAHIAGLVTGLAAKQDDLSADLKLLSTQLKTLLQRRNDTLLM